MGEGLRREQKVFRFVPQLRTAEGAHTLHQFIGNAAYDPQAAPDDRPKLHHGGGGADAAEPAGVLYQKGLRTLSRGGNGGADTGRAAADNDHIIGLLLYADLFFVRIHGLPPHAHGCSPVSSFSSFAACSLALRKLSSSAKTGFPSLYTPGRQS